jgi:hypothetical protein
LKSEQFGASEPHLQAESRESGPKRHALGVLAVKIELLLLEGTGEMLFPAEGFVNHFMMTMQAKHNRANEDGRARTRAFPLYSNQAMGTQQDFYF